MFIKNSEETHDNYEEELKDLFASLVSWEIAAVEQNEDTEKEPEKITPILSYDQFKLLKSTLHTVLYNLAKIDDEDKEDALMRELASKAYVWTIVDHDVDRYEKLSLLADVIAEVG